MPAKILDGEALAKRARLDSARRAAGFKKANGIEPGLAVVLAGKNPASVLYVGKKEEACKEVGIKSFKFEFPESVSEKELVAKIMELNARNDVHGMLVQLPLPAHIDKARVLEAIAPGKDVDGLTSANLGKLFAGMDCFEPCTPKGMIKLIESTGVEMRGKHAVVVGHSNLVGKPMAIMLLARGCTVTVCHKHTKGLAGHTKLAEILVSAVGKEGLIKAEMVKEGAIVVDAGIVKNGKKIAGDVDFEAVRKKAAWITPVPGGVGPMTVACLMENTIKAAEGRAKAKTSKAV